VAGWCGGDQQAAADLFDRYAQRLIGLVRSRLPARLTQRIDAEDVVQSAYRSFFVSARDGEIEYRHGSDLWRLLVIITIRKLCNQVGWNQAAKRSPQREQRLDALEDAERIEGHVRNEEPSPLETLALVEEVEQIMRGLSPPQRRIVEMRLQGHSFDDISAETHYSNRTVCRVLERVRGELTARLSGSS
jgi:RNA polymerase sigma-70 factor (ECF subfamily)